MVATCELEAAVKPGEVWKLGEVGDPRPFTYLVVEADAEGVDLVLLDSCDEPDCDPGDRVSLSWEDIKHDDGQPGRLVWEMVG